MSAQKPFRVILWGAGTLASALVRQLVKRDDFQITGMLCYSAEKAGKDIGEIAGIEPIGVRVTRDKERIFAAAADCVIVSVKDSNDYTDLDNDVIRLLESGKNVICSTTYFYPPIYGADHAGRLLQACKRGGVSLHGAGENPSMICERLALTLTGFCTEVEHITVHEYADIGALANPSMLAAAGIGRNAEQVQHNSRLVLDVWGPLYNGMAGFMAKAMYGAEPDRVHVQATVSPDITERDFSLSADFTAKAGTAVCINQCYRGHVDGRHFITLHTHWAYGVENSPVKDKLVPGRTYHVIEIEGKPISVRMTLEGQASFARDVVTEPGDPTIPIYNLAVAPIIQAVPVVCAAAPGFVFQSAFAHYKSDYRERATPWIRELDA